MSEPAITMASKDEHGRFIIARAPNRKAIAKLAARQAAFDALPPSAQRGRTRPGSLSLRKQG